MPTQEDLKFGKKAIELGLIDSGQLAYSLKLQKKYKRKGKYRSLSRLLAKQGLLNSTQVTDIENQCSINPNKTSSNDPTVVDDAIADEESVDIGATQVLTNSQINVPKKQKEIEFGRYKILEEIGQGGMAKVYRAYDPNLDRDIAIKFMSTIGETTEDHIKRFVREAKATAKLRHPNIIMIYDMGNEEGQPFFTMDFIKGVSLKRVIYEKEISPKQAVKVIKKIANAVEYAHLQGIIHRDLKPENVMMEKGKKPKVMDFGLAKIKETAQTLSRTGMIIGTLRYMSPEQAEGNVKGIDERTDIYGLGGILYEMLVRRPPFSGDRAIGVINQIINDPPISPREINSEIPEDLEIICLKALAKRQKNRYQTAAEFIEDLTRFEQGESLVSSKPEDTAKQKILVEEKEESEEISVKASLSKSRIKKKHSKRVKPRKSSTSLITYFLVFIILFLCSMILYVISSKSSPEDEVNKDEPTTDPKQQSSAKQIKLDTKKQTNGQNNTVDRETHKDDLKVKEEQTKREQEALASYNQLVSGVAQHNYVRRWELLNTFPAKYYQTEVNKRVIAEKQDLAQKTQQAIRDFINNFEQNANVQSFAEFNQDFQAFIKIRPTLQKMAKEHSQIELLVDKLDSFAERRESLWKNVYEKFVEDQLPKLIYQRNFIQIQQRIAIFRRNVAVDTMDMILKDVKQLQKLFSIASRNFIGNKNKTISVSLLDGKFIRGRVTKITRTTFTLRNRQGNLYTKNFTDLKGTQVAKYIMAKEKTAEVLYYLGYLLYCEEDTRWALKYFTEAEKKGSANASKCVEKITITQNASSDLQVEMFCPPVWIRGISQNIKIKVANTGKVIRNELVVSIELPAALILKKQDKESQEKPVSLWEIEKLETQEQRDFSLVLEPNQSGTYSATISLTVKDKQVKQVSQRFRIKSQKYGIPWQVWQQSSYVYNSGRFLDMASSYWQKLSAKERYKLAKAYQKGYANAYNKRVEKVFRMGKSSCTMVFIPPGRFLMGSSEDESGRESNERRHTVLISEAFWIQKKELTQQQWSGNIRSKPWKDKDNAINSPIHPATYISWNMINNRLLPKLKHSTYSFHLPTEAQWEYSCRAGTLSTFYWGNDSEDVKQYAWSKEEEKEPDIPYPTGQKKANNWGLHDMAGNVLEWCRDGWRSYRKTEETIVDPTTKKKSEAMTRGGYWENSTSSLRSARRTSRSPGDQKYSLGVRLVLVENKKIDKESQK